MGHDIYAYKRAYENPDAREEAYEKLCARFGREIPDESGTQWRDGFEQYGTETQVAYFRRSMGYYRGPHGALLYEVLGEKAKQHDAGVSGDGSEERFGADEIGMALHRLKEMALDPDNDVADELEFIQKCADALREQPDIVISFS